MSVVIVSWSAYSLGDVVSHEVANRLGYGRINDIVFKEASSLCGTAEEKVRTALLQPPSFFGMPLDTRLKCLACFQAAFAKSILSDRVVYDGPLGHFLVKGVSHVLKVSVTAGKADRAARMAEEKGISLSKAESVLEKMDKDQSALTKLLLSSDDDQSVFDMVVNTSRMDVDSAVAAICEAAEHKRYQPMTYSMKCIRDFELSCRVRCALANVDPRVQVQADGGRVKARLSVAGKKDEKRLAEIKAKLEGEPGIASLEIETSSNLADLVVGRLK